MAGCQPHWLGVSTRIGWACTRTVPLQCLPVLTVSLVRLSSRLQCSGYILEELRDPANFEQFKKDVGEANIFIGSLIFVQARAQ